MIPLREKEVRGRFLACCRSAIGAVHEIGRGDLSSLPGAAPAVPAEPGLIGPRLPGEGRSSRPRSGETDMRKALLTGAALAFVTAGAAWAAGTTTQGGPAPDGQGTATAGGAAGAPAASGTEAGPAPNKAVPTGGTTEGQGATAQGAKAGTAATAGAAGAAAAQGTEAGCPPDKAKAASGQGGQGGGQPEQAASTPSKC